MPRSSAPPEVVVAFGSTTGALGWPAAADDVAPEAAGAPAAEAAAGAGAPEAHDVEAHGYAADAAPHSEVVAHVEAAAHADAHADAHTAGDK